MPRFCARAAAAILIAIVVFQLALVAGAPWGAFTQGGQTAGTLPLTGRVAALVSAVILVVMALALLARADLGPWRNGRPRLMRVLAWLATAYAFLAVALNLATRSAHERAVFGPLSIVLLVLILTLMITTRGMIDLRDRTAQPRSDKAE